MTIKATITFEFERTIRAMREEGCSDEEIKEEIIDMIINAGFFPTNIKTCEVEFNN